MAFRSDIVWRKWEHGRLLTWDLSEPLVSVFDASGTNVLSSRIAVPETSRNEVSDVTISESGLVAVAGALQSAAYIAFLDAAGSMRLLLPTSPFAAYRDCFADDGTLWALGRQRAVYASVVAQQTVAGRAVENSIVCKLNRDTR